MTGMVEDLTPDPKRMKAAAGAGYATATDLADWLVRTLHMPFREAHHITGRIVALAAKRGVALEKLTLDEMRSVEPRITRKPSACSASSARSRAAPPMAEPRRRTCAGRRARGSSGWGRGDVIPYGCNAADRELSAVNRRWTGRPPRTRALQEMRCWFSLICFLRVLVDILAADQVPLILVVK